MAKFTMNDFVTRAAEIQKLLVANFSGFIAHSSAGYKVENYIKETIANMQNLVAWVVAGENLSVAPTGFAVILLERAKQGVNMTPRRYLRLLERRYMTAGARIIFSSVSEGHKRMAAFEKHCEESRAALAAFKPTKAVPTFYFPFYRDPKPNAADYEHLALPRFSFKF